MVLFPRNEDIEDTMPQTVPSAGFTPPCDYSNFAENFDLSLLPGDDHPVSPSTLFYTQSPPNFKLTEPNIYTTYCPSSPSENRGEDIELGPDFSTLLVPEDKKFSQSPVYLEVPSPKSFPNSPVGALSPYSPQSQGLLSPNDQFTNYRDGNLYPSSPEQSHYTASPRSVYSTSSCEDKFFIKKEYSNSTSPLPNFSPFRIKEEGYLTPPTGSPEHQLNIQTENTNVLELFDNTTIEKQIKKESTVDFSNILQDFQDADTLRQLLEKDLKKVDPEKPKDHQLLREALKDNSFQKKFNIKPFDFGFLEQDIKMEEPEQSDLLRTCATENIEPVLSLAIEQMKKDVDTTCATLGISTDPSHWDSASVLSWIRWTSRQFNLPEPVADQWDMTGSNLVTLSEEDFTRRAPQPIFLDGTFANVKIYQVISEYVHRTAYLPSNQMKCNLLLYFDSSKGGMILHAQLEIWKAAYTEDDLGVRWHQETTSSNPSSGDISEDDEDEVPIKVETQKPTTSRSGSHIHLWQFLKELLAAPQTHGSCIRWLDRTKGIFKIEDSVKVARLWGKRKNRPAMNYDKLSRSIRQYYKKGIMKKTERSQRLVYQFCHPYNL